jgi:hypothetical protein
MFAMLQVHNLIPNENEIERITEFIIKNYFHKDKEKIREVVKQHISYGTLAVEYDKADIVAVARWNINNTTVHILDLIIRKDYQRKGLIKKMLVRGLKVWKQLEYISFGRSKYNGRERMYSLEKFLGGQYGRNNH